MKNVPYISVTGPQAWFASTGETRSDFNYMLNDKNSYKVPQISTSLCYERKCLGRGPMWFEVMITI